MESLFHDSSSDKMKREGVGSVGKNKELNQRNGTLFCDSFTVPPFEGQINMRTPEPPEFSENTAKIHASSCPLCLSLFILCVALPRPHSKKLANLQLFTILYPEFLYESVHSFCILFFFLQISVKSNLLSKVCLFELRQLSDFFME